MNEMNDTRCKWILLALLSCAFFFHQTDRVLFGLLTIPIQDELHLTDLQIGWINRHCPQTDTRGGLPPSESIMSVLEIRRIALRKFE